MGSRRSMRIVYRLVLVAIAALAVSASAAAEVIDVTTIGAKRDGSADVSAIVNSNTHRGALFFPAGIYKVDRPLVLRNPIRGEGYSRSSNVDGSRTWLVSGIACTNGAEGVLEFGGDTPMNVENLNVMCNSRECGIRVADCRQGTYTFIDKVGIFNCAAWGVYVKGRGSRPIFMGNMTIFGSREAHGARATGIRLDGMADCRLSNIEIMGVGTGLELMAGHTYGDNIHLWTGAMGKREPGWWKGTRGVVIGRSAHFTGSEIYPDTCYLAFDMLGTGSFCEIRNIMVWEDKSVDGEADRAGSFVRYADPRNPGKLSIVGGLVGLRGKDASPGGVSRLYSPMTDVRDVVLQSDYDIVGENIDLLCLGRNLPDYTVNYADRGWCKVADVFTVAKTGSCVGVLTLDDGASWRLSFAKGTDGRTGMSVAPLNAMCDGRKIAGIEERGIFKVYVCCRDEEPVSARFVTESMCDRFRPLDHGSLRARSGAPRWRDVRETLPQPCPAAQVGGRFIDVCPDAPRYFKQEDGRSWIPVGCNICWEWGYKTDEDRETCEKRFLARMRRFAANGGNFMRIWLGHAFFEVMPAKAGEYDAAATGSLKRIVRLAEELGIRIKFTLENFRTVLPDDKIGNGKRSLNRSLYSPYASDMPGFFASEKCFDIYMGKARYLKSLGFGDSPAVICWELWNEINATGPICVYAGWSGRAMAAMQELFPRQMVVQNLGSFDDPQDFLEYDYLAGLDANAYMQVHRYLDPAASLDVCRGPMDVLCADAVRELLDRRPDRPAVLAETGAVLPGHAGPSDLYAADRKGMLLHDEIFAPFFAGSAGSGQPWHWDGYIDRNGLWRHFKLFAKAVEGLDPVAERFRPFRSETKRLRIYGLGGRRTTVLWCRDKKNTWQTECRDGVQPETLQDVELPFDSTSGFSVYLPWEDKTVPLPPGKCRLPSFQRSCVVRLAKSLP